MFLAVRDLKHAKGRFALIVLAVALMTLLVGFLSGLTGGLASQNISSLVGLSPDRVAFSMAAGESPSFAKSEVTEAQAAEWRAAEGVDAVSPLGISTVLLEGPNGGVARSDAPDAVYLSSAAVAMFAAEPGAMPDVPVARDGIVLGSDTAAELGVGVGDALTLAGRALTVTEIVAPQAHAHQAVAWVQLAAFHDYLADTHRPAVYANVLLIDGAGEVDAAAVDAAAGTTTQPFLVSLLALEAFKSEIGSLGLMIGMLVAIAVLVIGVFFLVWSMQRQRDIAVLKALGAGSGWLRRDALGQALLVLVIGSALGIGATLALGAAAAVAVPFTLSWITMGLPAIGMIAAGLLGALVSLRQITRVDPLVALGAAA